MNDRISIKGIEVLARHGVLAEEQEIAQVFIVDVELYADLSTAGNSDQLEDTIDYGEIALQVREVVGAESHQLIEKVASRVADVVMSDDRVQKAIVTIHKPQAPIDLVFNDVSVTVERSR